MPVVPSAPVTVDPSPAESSTADVPSSQPLFHSTDDPVPSSSPDQLSQPVSDLPISGQPLQPVPDQPTSDQTSLPASDYPADKVINSQGFLNPAGPVYKPSCHMPATLPQSLAACSRKPTSPVVVSGKPKVKPSLSLVFDNSSTLDAAPSDVDPESNLMDVSQDL